MVLSSYDDEMYILGSVHHTLKVGSNLRSQTKKLQWLTIRNATPHICIAINKEERDKTSIPRKETEVVTHR